MKVTYYAAMSIDGFIATTDGDVSWLDNLDIDYAETGYEDFFASVDCLVMGRHTYNFVHSYGTWPYEDKLTWVCTSTPLQIVEGAHIETASSIEKVLEAAQTKGLKHLWLVGGGELASGFLNGGLLTHLSISKMPLSLGAGIPLFSQHSIATLSKLSHQEIKQSGFTQLQIEIAPRSNDS